MKTKHINPKRLLNWILPLAVFLLMAIILQMRHEYRFLSLETMQLFFWDSTWISGMAMSIGGCSKLLSFFLLQFYGLPFVGALLTAALFWLSAWSLWQACWRMGAPVWTAPLCLLPSAWLWLLMLNYSFTILELTSFTLAMVGLWIYTLIHQPLRRSIIGAGLAVLLFLIDGPWTVTFVLAAFVFDLCVKGESFPKRLFGLLPIAALLVVAILAYKLAWIATLDNAFVPQKESWLYMPDSDIFLHLGTILTIVALVLCRVLSRFTLKSWQWQLVLGVVLFIVIGGYTLQTEKKGEHHRQEQLAKLIYLTEKDKWQDVFNDDIYQYSGNGMLMNYVFLAASHQGNLLQLVNTLQQAPPQALCIGPSLQFTNAKILAMIYFHVGIPAAAQTMAFESTQPELSAKSLQILVQTNLAFGADKVAEKYIRLLEHTLFYRSWAKQMRHLLTDKKAREKDLEISRLKKNIHGNDAFVIRDEFYDDLTRTLTNNPQNLQAASYALSWIMLSHDRNLYDDFFSRFINYPAVKKFIQPAN